MLCEKKNSQVYRLVKDRQATTETSTRVFDDVINEEAHLHHVTTGIPTSPPIKQAYIEPAEKTYKPTNVPPRGKVSTSYPEGCFTYYVKAYKRLWPMDRGHMIPHADTHTQNKKAVPSTKDPENIVPQESKFNRYVRNQLEAYFRKEGLDYKDITVYHREHTFEVSTSKEGKDTFLVPVPEGFLIIAYGNERVKEVYYFPNFVDYTTLRTENDLNAQEFWEIYELKGIEEWFFIPSVQEGDPQGQQDQIFLAEQNVEKITDYFLRYF